MAPADTRRVRETEQLDWGRMEEWLREQSAICDIANVDVSGPMEVAQFPGGHSNLTYLIRFGNEELVVRRPPLGPVAPTAHDMAREFRWLSAVHPVFPRAPRAYVLCEDLSVVGSVFYVMERRRGLVVRDDEPTQLLDRPANRHRLSEAVVDALGDLHAVDVAAGGLLHLGKPAGFVERQVRGWTERWERSRTTTVAEMDAVIRWLVDHLPPNPAVPTVVHGDFKLDNLLLDGADANTVTAVLDWEMSALGDPLIDVGILLAYWLPASASTRHDALATVTSRQGYFTRAELIERYARRTGRDVSGLRFFEVFALFKIAVVVQQIYYRFLNGQTDDARFANLGARVADLAQQAAKMAGM